MKQTITLSAKGATELFKVAKALHKLWKTRDTTSTLEGAIFYCVNQKSIREALEKL